MEMACLAALTVVVAITSITYVGQMNSKTAITAGKHIQRAGGYSAAARK